jgi:hypothetical protein
VNELTPLPRASHVNCGTSVPHDELPWPEHQGPVLRHRKLHLEHDERPNVANLGGLALPLAVVRRYGMARILDERVHVFKVHRPYHESDHIIAQVLMLYAGGTCLEDMAMVQTDPAVLAMLGAVRTPDPTTSGDFLRRFEPDGQLESLTAAIDEIQDRVWNDPKRWRRFRRSNRKLPLVVLYLDGHTEETYGQTHAGADFSYNGKWSYGALILSLADGECVSLRLRSGNLRSSNGAAEAVEEALPRLLVHYRRVLVVADSDFDRADLRRACERHRCYYAFVGRETENRPAIAAACQNWRPFETRAHRLARAQRRERHIKPRRKKINHRRRKATERGYTDLQLARQLVGETEGPGGTRLVIRKQNLEIHEGSPGQRELWHRIRYRYIITNLPPSWSAEEVIDQTYQRCDQENLIEGLGSGIRAWRLPVAEMRGNAAWLELARLAWNLKVWISHIALPEEVSRWEWKRFRRAFVDVAVQIVHTARQLHVRLLGAHRFAEQLMRAHALLEA